MGAPGKGGRGTFVFGLLARFPFRACSCALPRSCQDPWTAGGEILEVWWSDTVVVHPQRERQKKKKKKKNKVGVSRTHLWTALDQNRVRAVREEKRTSWRGAARECTDGCWLAPSRRRETV